MRLVPLLLLAISLGSLPSQGQASMMLFERELKFNTSVNNFDIDELDFDLVLMDDILSPTSSSTLFDDLVITPSHEGHEFDRTIVNDPGFSDAVARLQDSLNENIRYIVTENELGGLSEKRGGSESSFFLFGKPTNAPLMASATIDQFTLKVIEFPELAGQTAPVEIELQLQIFGTVVPEPSTGWLFAAGIGTLGILLFNRRRRPLLA